MLLVTGDTIFYRGLTGFSSRLQQVVLNTDLSHSSYIAGLLNEKTYLELEADIKVRLHSFLDIGDPFDKEHHQLFRWNPEIIDQKIVEKTLFNLRHFFEDKYYGFGQWLTIAIRRAFELLGAKEARSWSIRFLGDFGTVCSELLYFGDKIILEETHKLNARPQYNQMILNMLKEFGKYNHNLFTPPDLRKIYYEFPKIKYEVK